MSHSIGAALFKDGLIKYFDGTVNMCQPKLFNTAEELLDNWRTREFPMCNNSEHNHQRVRIATSYGGGFSWDGFACLDCNILLSPLDIDYATYRDGLPDWFPT